jgi:hypothetical protein
LLLCISTGRETLADSIKPFETAQRKPSKDGQKENPNREEHSVKARPVKHFQNAGDVTNDTAGL